MSDETIVEHTPAPEADAPAHTPAPEGDMSVPPIEAAPGLDPAHIRAELHEIRFSIRSGITNGLERLDSLIRHVEARM